MNRVSIGVQSFDKDQLKFLGREHSAEEALKAIDIAAKHFENFSFDLIYALPKQTLKDWEKELKYAISLGSKHMSLYQLTIEKGTPFFKMHKDKSFEMPTSDYAADFYELTHNLMNEARMPAYEVSNHAKDGYECEHNLVYWRYEDYIGIGPGAHGRYTYKNQKFATVKQHNPQSWLKLVESTGIGLQKIEELDSEDERVEKVLMGIRTSEGVQTSVVKKDVQHLLDSGMLQKIGNRFIASFKGTMLLNKLTEEMI